MTNVLTTEMSTVTEAWGRERLFLLSKALNTLLTEVVLGDIVKLGTCVSVLVPESKVSDLFVGASSPLA